MSIIEFKVKIPSSKSGELQKQFLHQLMNEYGGCIKQTEDKNTFVCRCEGNFKDIEKQVQKIFIKGSVEYFVEYLQE